MFARRDNTYIPDKSTKYSNYYRRKMYPALRDRETFEWQGSYYSVWRGAFVNLRDKLELDQPYDPKLYGMRQLKNRPQILDWYEVK